MSDIEDDFFLNVAREVNSVNRNITDESVSKHGLKKNMPPELLQKLKEQQVRNGFGGGNNPLPTIPEGNTNLEQIQITPEMIKEIQEYGEDAILPELKKNKALGNEYMKPLQQNAEKKIVDDNQLEFDFTRVMRVEDVHDLITEMKIEFKKEIKGLKSLLEETVKSDG